MRSSLGSCADGWRMFNGTCYLIVTGGDFEANWVQANDYCKSTGGNMLLIERLHNIFQNHDFSTFRFAFNCFTTLPKYYTRPLAFHELEGQNIGRPVLFKSK